MADPAETMVWILASAPEMARVARLVLAMRAEIGLGIEKTLTARQLQSARCRWVGVSPTGPSILCCEKRFLRRLEVIAARYPPRLEVELEALADMFLAVTDAASSCQT